MESLSDLLSLGIWLYLKKLAERYPILVGVPLTLLPLCILAGMIYLIATWN